MFQGTDNDWQNLPKSKQIKMVADMLDRIKNDYPDENLAEKISLLAMNRMMFSLDARSRVQQSGKASFWE